MEKTVLSQVMMDFVNDFMARIIKQDVWKQDDIHTEICFVMFDSALKYLGQEKE